VALRCGDTGVRFLGEVLLVADYAPEMSACQCKQLCLDKISDGCRAWEYYVETDAANAAETEHQHGATCTLLADIDNRTHAATPADARFTSGRVGLVVTGFEPTFVRAGEAFTAVVSGLGLPAPPAEFQEVRPSGDERLVAAQEVLAAQSPRLKFVAQGQECSGPGAVDASGAGACENGLCGVQPAAAADRATTFPESALGGLTSNYTACFCGGLDCSSGWAFAAVGSVTVAPPTWTFAVTGTPAQDDEFSLAISGMDAHPVLVSLVRYGVTAGMCSGPAARFVTVTPVCSGNQPTRTFQVAVDDDDWAPGEYTVCVCPATAELGTCLTPATVATSADRHTLTIVGPATADAQDVACVATGDAGNTRAVTGMTWFVDPGQSNSIEITKDGGDPALNSERDRLMVIPGTACCGVAAPVLYSMLYYATLKPLTVPVSPAVEEVYGWRNYDEHKERYCDGNNIQDARHAAHKCGTKCAAGEAAANTAACAGHYVASADDAFDNALCFEPATIRRECERLCDDTRECYGIDLHEAAGRCWLNDEHCVSDVVKGQLAKDRYFTFLVRRTYTFISPEYSWTTSFTLGEDTTATANRRLSESDGYSSGDLLRFYPFAFPTGDYKICFCDSSLLDGDQECTEPKHFQVEVGVAHASPLSGILHDSRLRKAGCENQWHGGLVCVDTDEFVPSQRTPLETLLPESAVSGHLLGGLDQHTYPHSGRNQSYP